MIEGSCEGALLYFGDKKALPFFLLIWYYIVIYDVFNPPEPVY